MHHPFFVMELVMGVPITEYCDARKLTPKGRMGLFVPVRQGIQHTYQNEIIHRDIKPSNVLIALPAPRSGRLPKTAGVHRPEGTRAATVTGRKITIPS